MHARFVCILAILCRTYRVAELCSEVWQKRKRSSFRDCVNAKRDVIVRRCPFERAGGFGEVRDLLEEMEGRGGIV